MNKPLTTVAFAALAAGAWSQSAPPSVGIVYGTYNIEAHGSIPRQRIGDGSGSATYRTETFDASFQMRFSKGSDGRPIATIVPHKYDHEIVYEVENPSDPRISTITRTTYKLGALATRPKTMTGSLMRGYTHHNGNNVRNLTLSFGEPFVDTDVTTTTTVKVGLSMNKQPVTTRKALDERLLLVLDWTQAIWRPELTGFVSDVDDLAYKDPQGHFWMKVTASWALKV